MMRSKAVKSNSSGRLANSAGENPNSSMKRSRPMAKLSRKTPGRSRLDAVSKPG